MNSNTTYLSCVPALIQVLCQVFSFNPHNNPLGIIIYILQMKKSDLPNIT